MVEIKLKKRSGLRGGLVLAVGGLASAICSFARNILIARLISVEDFGIAATFAMTMSLIEMASNLALDRLIVQFPDGDDPRLIATAHAFQFARATIASLLLLAVAGPVASLFQVPQVTWAFRVIAIVPLIRGLMHLDWARQQREMRFASAVWMDSGSQLLVTILAIPMAMWLGDFRVMLAVVICQVTAMTILSHLFADRPYRWAWDLLLIKRMLRFGWPLLLNGLLMFVILQGDKTIVGAGFSMKELGYYSAAFSMALLPSMVLAKVLSTFLLPLLSSVQHENGLFTRRATVALDLCVIGGVAVGMACLLVGPSMLCVTYGDRYVDGIFIVGWLGLMQVARLSKAGPTIVAMSKGDTTNPFFANLVRCIGFGLAIACVASGYGVQSVAICGLIGEILAATASIVLLRIRFGFTVGHLCRFSLVAIGVLVPVTFVASRWFQGLVPGVEIPVGIAVVLLSCSVLSLFVPGFWGFALERFEGWKRGSRVPTGHPATCAVEGE